MLSPVCQMRGDVSQARESGLPPQSRATPDMRRHALSHEKGYVPGKPGRPKKNNGKRAKGKGKAHAGPAPCPPLPAPRAQGEGQEEERQEAAGRPRLQQQAATPSRPTPIIIRGTSDGCWLTPSVHDPARQRGHDGAHATLDMTLNNF